MRHPLSKNPLIFEIKGFFDRGCPVMGEVAEHESVYTEKVQRLLRNLCTRRGFKYC